MIYPENIEKKIGFNEIKNLLFEYSTSEMGKEYVSKISFLNDYKKIHRLLKQTTEFKNILQLEDSFPAKNFFDLRKVLIRLRTEGSYIFVEDLHDLNLSLLSSQEIIHYFNQERQGKYPEIFQLLSFINFDKYLLNEIHLIIDEKGRIRENASEDLRSIRRKILSLNSGIRNKAQTFLRKALSEGWVREGADLSVRDNRMVIPMLATHKRKIRGFIHDESSSGQTVYIEPAELFETNNQIRELQIEEEKEIRRILLKLSDKIRPHIDDLLEVYKFLGLIDFISAKAKLAIELNANMPNFQDKCLVNWKEVYHPILLLNYKKRNKKVIPQDFLLDNQTKIIMISGPNAGGKSVSLKTLGLNQYMLQSGLLIPLKSTSEAGIFSDLFIDIGDEQSLDDDLSTYSSHLSNIKFFTQNVSNRSLILIDEFGSGTEPDLGGAIAEASLKYLYEKGAFALITTHYSNLKEFADKYKGVVNAAMSFDSINMRPSFKMKVGKPGSSFAFEIAQKIGLNKDILNYATNIAGKDRINFDRRLQELDAEKERVERKKKEIESADDFLSETIQKYENIYKKLQLEKSEIIKDAKKEAKEIINNSNRLIEKTIKEINEAKADKNKTKKIRAKFEEEKKEILNPKKSKKPKAEIPQLTIEKPKTTQQKIDFKEGDFVKIKNQSGVGIIEKLKSNSAVVSFDTMKFDISIEKLELSETKKTKVNRKSNYNDLYHNKSNDFQSVLDIRGKRADDAINEVLEWFDNAVLLGEYDLQILHGKGNGILRQIVRQALSKNSEVSSLKDAPIDMGGAGITIVDRKK